MWPQKEPCPLVRATLHVAGVSDMMPVKKGRCHTTPILGANTGAAPSRGTTLGIANDDGVLAGLNAGAPRDEKFGELIAGVC